MSSVPNTPTSQALVKISGLVYTDPGDGSTIDYTGYSQINSVPFTISTSANTNNWQSFVTLP